MLKLISIPRHQDADPYSRVLRVWDDRANAPKRFFFRPASQHSEWNALGQFIRINRDQLNKNPNLILNKLSHERTWERAINNSLNRLGYRTRAFVGTSIPSFTFKMTIKQEIIRAFSALQDLDTNSFFALLSPLNQYIPDTPLAIEPLKMRSLRSSCLLPMCVPPDFRALDAITNVEYLKNFHRSLHIAFRRLTQLKGIDLYSGFVHTDAANERVKSGYLFIENPFFGNMGTHSPAHPFQFFALRQLLAQSQTHISDTQILENLITHNMWGEHMDTYIASRQCPHYIGNEVMGSPDQSNVLNIQRAFRFLYLMAIKGIALRLKTTPQCAVLTMTMSAQNAGDYNHDSREKIAQDLQPLCGKYAMSLSARNTLSFLPDSPVESQPKSDFQSI